MKPNHSDTIRYVQSVPFRKMMSRIARPIEEIDRERLGEFASDQGGQPISDLRPRARGRVAGEIRSVRIVPRAGAPALEVQISDGKSALVAVFLGRRKIGGVITGRRLIVQGMVLRHDGQLVMFNPLYELL